LLERFFAEGADEARRRLSDFYKRLALAPTGRTTMMLAGAR
jgi:hypothetical protein